jgi:hypothetical protein
MIDQSKRGMRERDEIVRVEGRLSRELKAE